MSLDKTPFFTIIIPFFNAQGFLKDCIESVVHQSFRDFELFLIDDGSHDNSAAICHDFAQNDSRVLLFTEKHGGVSRARNIGLDRACGSYIIFLDADDVFLPESLDLYYKTILSTQADIVKCGYEEGFGDNWLSHVISHDMFIGDHNTFKMLEATEESCYYGFLWNTAFRRECIDGIRFDTTLSWLEDHIFSRQCFERCDTMALVGESVYRHFIRPGSLGSVRDPFMILDGAFKEYQSRMRLLPENQRKEYERKERLVYGRMINALKHLRKESWSQKMSFLKAQRACLKQIPAGRFRYLRSLFERLLGVSR